MYESTLWKRLAILPSPAGMSKTKLALAGNNLIIPGQSLDSDITAAGDGKIANLFYSVLFLCTVYLCIHYIYVYSIYMCTVCV
jgi:hypothetical protein